MSRSTSVRLLLQGIRRVKAPLSTSSRAYPPSQNLCFRCISTIPPPTAKRLEGKMAIIVGAASGIGETTARFFAAHGARVLIADVQNAETLAKELGNGSEFIHCDVRNEEQVAAAVDKGVLMGEGRVDVFHHNAGILGAIGPIDETRMAEFDYTMDVNIRGAFLGVKHAARVMKPAKKGSIICTGSVGGVVGGLAPHAYTISKTALVGLVRSASVELRGFGIRVNVISPDGVPTQILAQAVHILECEPLSMDLAEKKAKEFSPLPDRSLNTMDVAQAALFLATEDSGFISGHNLMLDCGNTVTKPNDNARWLKGKTAIIVGAASGIGETTARLFAAHGARVLIADVQDAQNLAEKLGNGSQFIFCDVKKEDQVAAAVAKGVSMGEGKVDIFHHNAGILGAVGPIDETRMSEFDYTMAVNLRGAFMGIKHIARVMKAANKGSIICTGSVGGVVGGLGPHAYSISKTALVGLVRSASVELRGFGIRVNMISPHSVPTQLLAQARQILDCEPFSMELAEKKAKENSVMPDRWLSTLDVAQAALFLAAEDSGFISGHNLVVDCGHTVTKPNDNARWYTTHSPLFREAAETGMD